MADNKVFSGKKIVSSVVKANMKFWGGDKVPILNAVTNAFLDPQSVLDQFKGDPSDKQKLKMEYAAADKNRKLLQQEESVLVGYKNGFLEIANQLSVQKLAILTATPSGFSNNVAYKITNNILKALDLDTVLTEETYKGVTNSAPPQLKTSYEMLIRKMKEIDQKVIGQLGKINNIKQQLKRHNKNIKDTIDKFNKNK